MRRRMLGVVIATLLVAVTTPVVVAGPASATAFRYWSYWHDTTGSWTFSQVGAQSDRPPDGSVEGWHFAISPGSTAAPAPRLDPSTAFSSVCGATPAQSGQKRVALVVDFGTSADAPAGDSPPSDPLHGSCVVLPPTATGWDALVTAGYAIRAQDSGLVCGLAGYPSQGCGVVVADPAPSASAAPKATSAANNPTTATHAASNAAARTVTSTTARRHAAASAATPHATSTSMSSAAATASTSSSTADGASSRIDAAAANTPSPEASPSLVAGPPAQAGSGSGGTRGVLLALLGLLVVGGIGTAAVRRGRRTP